MTIKPKERLKGMLIIPIVLGVILLIFSKALGWNLTTLILYWFACIPILSVYLPRKISKNKNHLSESLSGLMIFYLLMVFLIYKQYNSDYFKIMIASAVINAGLVLLITVTAQPRMLTEHDPGKKSSN